MLRLHSLGKRACSITFPHCRICLWFRHSANIRNMSSNIYAAKCLGATFDVKHLSQWVGYYLYSNELSVYDDGAFVSACALGAIL